MHVKRVYIDLKNLLRGNEKFAFICNLFLYFMRNSVSNISKSLNLPWKMPAYNCQFIHQNSQTFLARTQTEETGDISHLLHMTRIPNEETQTEGPTFLWLISTVSSDRRKLCCQFSEPEFSNPSGFRRRDRERWNHRPDPLTKCSFRQFIDLEVQIWPLAINQGQVNTCRQQHVEARSVKVAPSIKGSDNVATSEAPLDGIQSMWYR